MTTPPREKPWQNYICLSLIRWEQSVSFYSGALEVREGESMIMVFPG